MTGKIAIGILIPFIGTGLGAAMVFFLKGALSDRIRRMLTGFAAGVMVSASFWGLLQPALDGAAGMGKLAFIPPTAGFIIGIALMVTLDKVIPHVHEQDDKDALTKNRLTKMFLAVTLHNIPEGMAVGVVYAGWLTGNSNVTYAGAFSLALGIALQNFPEGAIISMPLHMTGMSKTKTFLYGILSGIVEPLAALLALLAASSVASLLPYVLAFAAGAMIYVVADDLIPDMSDEHHSQVGLIAFSLGFILMMILEVVLG